MNKTRLLLSMLLLVLSTSCIPTKDLIYLQNQDASVQSQSVEKINSTPYRVQINDILTINIRSLNPELTEIFNTTQQNQSVNSDQMVYFNGYGVDDHGNIKIPILGDLNVLGFTLEEISKTIEEKLYKEYFTKQAGIYVTVKLAGLRFVINGEVTNPGTKTLYQDRVNILEAIANAGDITITGDRRDVVVLRRTPSGTETYHVDLTTTKAFQSPVFNLQPNDYVYVKPLKQKTWGTGRTGIESMTTIITLLSLTSTIFLLLRN